jgi:hypothetical protein
MSVKRSRNTKSYTAFRDFLFGFSMYSRINFISRTRTKPIKAEEDE